MVIIMMMVIVTWSSWMDIWTLLSPAGQYSW